MPLPRSMAEILGAHSDALKGDIRKVLPATITAVHPDRQTVDVQIAINNPVFDDLGNAYTEPAPSISDVPLGVMRGGGFLVWLPVAVGDSVLLVFSDLSTDNWRAGDGTAQDPGWMGKHTFDSPFALPMVAPDAKFFSDPNAAPTSLIIGQDGGASQIRISPTTMQIDSTSQLNIGPTVASIAIGGSAGLPAARVGDPVAAGPFAGTITSGSAKVTVG